MKLSRVTVRRAAIAVGAVLAVGLAAPYFDAGRFASRVKQSLEQGLGRKVAIGAVHLNLFQGPGFSVDEITIYDDARAGAEPFIIISRDSGSLDARVSFLSLFAGRLEFSSLRLDNPSVNLVKTQAGPWNFEELLGRTVGAEAASRIPEMPEIHVRGGRINFKLGDTKSIFYLKDTSLDVLPPSSPGGEWNLWFEGEPARTDRAAYGFGTLAASGQWRPDARTGGRIDMALDLRKSSLSDLIRLVHGQDLGIDGQITAHARLLGPGSEAGITGHVDIAGIHRWDLLPPYGGGWSGDFRGRLDLVSQSLEFETVPPPGGTLPVSVHTRIYGYLSQPRWEASATLSGMPLAPAPDIARHMGIPLPPGLTAEGELSGSLTYSQAGGLQGTVTSDKASVAVAGSAPVDFEGAEIAFNGPKITLAPAVFRTSAREQGRIEAEYSTDTQSLDATISTSSMTIAGEAENAPARLLGTAPLLSEFTKGTWSGKLRYRSGSESGGVWTGSFEVQNAAMAVPGMSEPVAIESARVLLRDGAMVMDRIVGRAGTIDFKGQYRYREGAQRPHRFRLAAGDVNAAEIERLFRPSLDRGDSLLARALRLGRRAAAPEWLEARHAEAVLEAASFTAGDVRLDRLHANLRWDGTAVEAPAFTAEYGKGTVAGQFTANLRRDVPNYRAAVKFRDVDWIGGEWSGESTVETSGAGAGLVRNLRADTTFSGASVNPWPGLEFKALSGRLLVTAPRGIPRLRFPSLRAAVGDEVYEGSGTTGLDGRIRFDLSNGRGQLRFGGTLSPLHLELLPPERAEK
jgi:hypothetical protein